MTTGYLSAAIRLRAGVPYTVWGNVVLWHQGTVDQAQQAINHPGQPGVLWGNDVATEVPFTFQ